MPSAARLIAALCLAAVGWCASELVKGQFDPDKAFGLFSVLNGFLGFIIGWTVIGSRAGRGLSAGISNGITGGVVLVFWALFLQGAYEMVIRSMRLRYDGAFEAAAAVFELMSEYAALLLTLPIMGVLIFGSVLSGGLAEAAFKKYGNG